MGGKKKTTSLKKIRRACAVSGTAGKQHKNNLIFLRGRPFVGDWARGGKGEKSPASIRGREKRMKAYEQGGKRRGKKGKLFFCSSERGTRKS